MTGVFSGKVALVTAAGAGIGMATAEGFARLCSDQAGMVTGHVLPVDGGWTAQ